MSCSWNFENKLFFFFSWTSFGGLPAWHMRSCCTLRNAFLSRRCTNNLLSHICVQFSESLVSHLTLPTRISIQSCWLLYSMPIWPLGLSLHHHTFVAVTSEPRTAAEYVLSSIISTLTSTIQVFLWPWMKDRVIIKIKKKRKKRI